MFETILCVALLIVFGVSSMLILTLGSILALALLPAFFSALALLLITVAAIGVCVLIAVMLSSLIED